jgi:hypothetical protein
VYSGSRGPFGRLGIRRLAARNLVAAPLRRQIPALIGTLPGFGFAPGSILGHGGRSSCHQTVEQRIVSGSDGRVIDLGYP